MAWDLPAPEVSRNGSSGNAEAGELRGVGSHCGLKHGAGSSSLGVAGIQDTRLIDILVRKIDILG